MRLARFWGNRFIYPHNHPRCFDLLANLALTMKRIHLTLLLIAFTVSAMHPVCSSPSPKQKVIFDCDLAGDVDDAYALALLLASPEFEVPGLVMDHGNTAKRARVACRFLYELGLDEAIPVVVGRPTPSVVGESEAIAGDSNQFIWGDGFDRFKPVEENAADFIVRNLRTFPHEVILITVGPVCNMQDVIEKDPHALGLAKRVVSMFGSFYMGYDEGPVPDAEWNVRADG